LFSGLLCVAGCLFQPKACAVSNGRQHGPAWPRRSSG
jgi:hypothetical protein